LRQTGQRPRLLAGMTLLALAIMLIACAGGLAWSSRAAAALCVAAPERPLLQYQIVRVLPHDPKAYTQGLLISGDTLFESTGLYGHSSLRRLELKSARQLARVSLPARLFGEGIALAQGRLLQLSWREGEVRIYHPDSLQLQQTKHIEGEGWGLTFDGQRLIQSDGSAMLIFRDPEDLRELERLQVRTGEQALSGLNELQYANGRILANIYPADCVAVIDPGDGQVVGWLDMKTLASELRRDSPSAEVTNGIAYDPVADTYYLTGKRWPTLFELRINALAKPSARAADRQ